ncbi:Glycosyl hydrolases family 43 [Anaerosporobacter mobilis DSM 15930]|uniref:Glycosyl hydrolases family 43 n=1 Tax=Anaerosporobacter mobilis DSM 15930 TaxID=1120996 RepID=A0A1M7F880_9FIRM|nr:family 43 glycosylhydrolase [Anaerosporobacter mobilis]SHL99909.1 Glycosyl hydrolases family 43 [Anaerosporobacter mobilis DSM 15930]
MNPNPIIKLDYPDPDVIRVGDTYYMVSTTMHFMPGCEILRSYDLIHWEHATYVYETLDSTEGQCMEGKKISMDKVCGQLLYDTTRVPITYVL